MGTDNLEPGEREAGAGAERPMLTVKLVRSAHGRLKRHRACVAGLGLRRIGHVVQVEDTPAVRGMIAKVGYLLQVEPAAEHGG